MQELANDGHSDDIELWCNINAQIYSALEALCGECVKEQKQTGAHAFVCPVLTTF